MKISIPIIVVIATPMTYLITERNFAGVVMTLSESVFVVFVCVCTFIYTYICRTSEGGLECYNYSPKEGLMSHTQTERGRNQIRGDLR